MANLSTEEINRYSQHLILKGFGQASQEILKDSKVLIVGVGGLGSTSSLYLASAGIGNITLLDSDTVSVSNLQRQVIHFDDDIGKEKILSAKNKLERINPDIKVSIINDHLMPNNAEKFLRGFNFVLDCTDNFESKFLINNTCVSLKIPFSYAGVTGYEGQTMTVLPRKSACLGCVFGSISNLQQATVPEGILATVPGIFGLIQATEAIKYLTGFGSLLTNRLLVFDSLKMSFREVKVSLDNNCSYC